MENKMSQLTIAIFNFLLLQLPVKAFLIFTVQTATPQDVVY